MKLIIIRKSSVLTFLLVILILLALITMVRYKKIILTTSNIPSTAKVIVIDPGHGGIDPGAIGKTYGSVEKDINLAIGKFLRNYLEKSGALVIMTRDTDKGLYTQGGSIRSKKIEDLRNRKKIAVDNKANLFITIHLNSFPQSKYYGAQVFYPADNPNSKVFAKTLQEELRNVLDTNNTRVALPKDNVYIIKGLDIPTVLVECGFLSNPNEEKKLMEESYQKKIAWALFLGIQRFLNENQ